MIRRRFGRDAAGFEEVVTVGLTEIRKVHLCCGLAYASEADQDFVVESVKARQLRSGKNIVCGVAL